MVSDAVPNELLRPDAAAAGNVIAKKSSVAAAKPSASEPVTAIGAILHPSSKGEVTAAWALFGIYPKIYKAVAAKKPKLNYSINSFGCRFAAPKAVFG